MTADPSDSQASTDQASTDQASTDQASPDQASTVRDNAAASQFEIFLGSKRAGFAQYRRTAGHITFTHTVIEPEFEGKGVGGRLAKAALDAARADGLLVTPRCPFIAEYIRRHPAYTDIVDPAANFH